MLEIFLALAWYNILVVGVLLVIFTFCAFNEIVEGSAIFLAASIFVLNYFDIIPLTNIDWSTVIYSIMVYLAVGCIWSLFKYKQRAEELAIGYNENKHYNQYTREQIVQKIKYEIKNSQIAYWIIFFPISMIKFALSDFVDYLISKLGRVYDYIARSVVDVVFKDSIKE